MKAKGWVSYWAYYVFKEHASQLHVVLTNIWDNQLIKDFFWLKVWKFQFMMGWPYCFGLVVRKHIMVEMCGRAKLLPSWVGSKRESEEGLSPTLKIKIISRTLPKKRRVERRLPLFLKNISIYLPLQGLSFQTVLRIHIGNYWVSMGIRGKYPQQGIL
jgi:hypothetical protein